jgi:antitoxin component YwqK of YwqJK toxin-antitoxin module
MSVKDGFCKYFHPNGILKAEIEYSKGTEIGKSYFYNEIGELIRLNVKEKNGAQYNIFNSDTVNITDSLGRKQGKWISLSKFSKDCSITPTSTEYYIDDKPTGIWDSFGYDGSCTQE